MENRNNGWSGGQQDYNHSYNFGGGYPVPTGDDFPPPSGGETPPGQTPPWRRKPKKNWGAAKLVALCLLCALIGGSVYPIYRTVAGSSTAIHVGQRTATELTTKTVDTEKELTPAELYNSYVGSTVGITVDLVGTNIFGQRVTAAAAGSGFVITENGYILTNYHVVENANEITVTFVDGKTYPATYVGGEKANDIAVIKIEAEGLTPVVLGSSDNMRVGEQVITIGNPLGELTFTETAGIISAVNRTITMSDGRKINMIQTDCAINSGNSGGPLFNLHGEVIGVVSAKYSGSGSSDSASVEGLGFAIPIDDVADIVSELVTNGYVSGKPFMGVGLGDVDEQAQAYGVPAGAVVSLAPDGLPAAKAGIQVGDIITALDGKAVKGRDELTAAVKEHAVGDSVTLSVFRSGEKLEVKVTLAESTPELQEIYEKALPAYVVEKAPKRQQQSQQGGYSYGWPFTW